MVTKRKRKPIYALKQWRILSSLSAAEAAMLIGTNENTFRRWETGERTVPQDKTARLTELTGLPRHVLLHQRGRSSSTLTPFKKPKGGREAFLQMVRDMNTDELPMTDGDQRVIIWESVRATLGGPTKVAEIIGVTPQAVNKYRIVPVRHCAALSAATGIPRSTMRPDFFGREEPGEALSHETIPSGVDERALSTSVSPSDTMALPTVEAAQPVKATNGAENTEELGFTFAVGGMTASFTVRGDISGILAKGLAQLPFGEAFSAHLLAKDSGAKVVDSPRRSGDWKQ